MEFQDKHTKAVNKIINEVLVERHCENVAESKNNVVLRNAEREKIMLQFDLQGLRMPCLHWQK